MRGEVLLLAQGDYTFVAIDFGGVFGSATAVWQEEGSFDEVGPQCFVMAVRGIGRRE